MGLEAAGVDNVPDEMDETDEMDDTSSDASHDASRHASHGDGDGPAAVVDVFADVWCPFAHVGLRGVVERRRQAGADSPRFRLRAWPLEIVNGEALDASAVAAEVADIRDQVADDLFVGFDPERFPSSTLVVLGTAEAAYRRGLDIGEAFSLAIRDALFEEGRAVDDPAVLADVAARFGVDVPSAGDARAAVEADLADGRRRGVTGSPHFFVDGESYFCPALDIAHDGDHLRISIDHDGLDRFLRRVFD